MSLDKIVDEAQIIGYNIEKGSDESTIQTKCGDVEVILNKGEGQPHCYIGKNQIQLFKDNKNIVSDLIHERDHFQIFPYDLITFGVGWGSAFAYSMYKISQTNDIYHTALYGAMELIAIGTHFVIGGYNLVGDGIIYAREKLEVNKVK